MTTSELFSSLVAPALAIAVNPVPIMACVALLATAHGKRNALYFIVTMWVHHARRRRGHHHHRR